VYYRRKPTTRKRFPERGLLKTAVVSQGVLPAKTNYRKRSEKGLFKTLVVLQGVLPAKTNYP
jgi:uncharacterized membrane protein YsdA (DUF1294 family)